MALYNTLQNAKPFFVIAGPCVIEDEYTMLTSAEFLTELCARFDLPLVFKSSYRKANRSSGFSATGPGLEAGLNILQKIKSTFDVPIVSDIHESCEVPAAAEVCDVLQIPAFLSRQTELIQAAALSKKIVNIKKGQFMAPEDMKAAAEKVNQTGNPKVLLTERGSSFGYHNLVVDFRSFAIMQRIGYPVIYDVTHSLQLPSSGHSTGGNPEFAPMMAAAAIATGKVNGLFIECHPNPEKALSDAATMLPLSQMEALLRHCVAIGKAIIGD